MKTETWSKYVSEYRRFISYIYEYQRGRKQNNCGYAKVEIRSGVFRLRLHLQPVGTDKGELQVYGFVRKPGHIYGILLGSVEMKNHAYDFQAVSQAAGIGGSAYPAGELRGIWLRGNGENYITIWDDEPVEVDQFTDRELEESAGGAEPHAGSTLAGTEEMRAGGALTGAERVQVDDALENAEKTQADDALVNMEKTQTDGALANVEKTQTDGALANVEKTQEVFIDEEAQGNNTPAGGDARRQESGEGIYAQSVAGTVPERAAWPGSLAGRWNNFLQHYPQIRPFTDEEITQCISIAPKDLSFLPREEWQFGKNPFLRQAFAQYHHLMLGCHASGRFVLAVPGSFRSMQEKHLARMSGFPYYKEAAGMEAADHLGTADHPETADHLGAAEESLWAASIGSMEPEGYWYHFLNEGCLRR